MNRLNEKFREVILSVVPIVMTVIILGITLVPIELESIFKFIISSILVVVGLAFFLLGVDLAVTPLGNLLGFLIVKKNKLLIVIGAAFVLGFIISIAEPGLVILGNQIESVTMGALSSTTLVGVVSLGIGLFMILGFLRLIYNLPLYIVLLISYGVVFGLSFFISPEYLAIAFDASGSTTGVLAVPFILSLSLGVTAMKKDSKASEKDSFGLVSIVSVGAILSVMLLGIFTEPTNYAEVLPETAKNSVSMLESFFRAFPKAFIESMTAFLPLIGIFIFICFLCSVSKKDKRRIAFGFIYALLGLTLFFVGVNTSFMEVGSRIGGYLATLDHLYYLIGIGFILGVVTILAEPAVYILVNQIEEVTSGYVKKSAVLGALALGVGGAVALSALRIVVEPLQLWHYLLPGYIIALALMFITPKLFVGIAFDAGGVATGPMTATFILAFINGAASHYGSASILVDGFGMIALVALMPIITLQLLGVFFRIKTHKKGVKTHDQQKA